MTGKGDVISCDYSTVKSLYIPQANASLRVQTQGEIHSVAWSDLIAVLKAYSSFREDFLNHLELAYNLGTEAEVRSIYNIIACSSLFSSSLFVALSLLFERLEQANCILVSSGCIFYLRE